MIICVCNNIREKDLKENPFLISKVGTKCGVCVREGVIECGKDVYIMDTKDQLKNQNPKFNPKDVSSVPI